MYMCFMIVCWFMLLPMFMEVKESWWSYSITVSLSSETRILKDPGARLVVSMPHWSSGLYPLNAEITRIGKATPSSYFSTASTPTHWVISTDLNLFLINKIISPGSPESMLAQVTVQTSCETEMLLQLFCLLIDDRKSYWSLALAN